MWSKFVMSAKTSTQLIRAGCWLCSNMHGHSIATVTAYAFGPTLSSCILAVLARMISKALLLLLLVVVVVVVVVVLL